jgi:eukaryotic-like serine/threonine-protein kinase
MDCLDEETILGFCRGQLAEEARSRAQEHISTCDECRQLVSAVARSSFVETPPRADLTEPSSDRDSERNAAEPRPLLRRLDPAMAATTPIGASALGPPASPVQPGEILAGKFEVERVLGAGGMGIVVAARHTQLDQRVALKFLLPVACEVPGAVARFLREGKAAARITSEHVARVMDTGVLAGGAPYLVMEYLEGLDLGALVQQRGGLPADEAIEYVLQACEAIVEAHDLGIVHRDLKPANLFLAHRADGSPLVKVLDFGISKVAGSGSRSQLTSASVLMGSPRYMSPEQMMSAKDVDARTDVWALGVILYELVTGKAVWHADTMQGLCALIASAPAPRLRESVANAPPILEDVICRCLAKAVGDRIASVADLAQALEPIAPSTSRTSIERILRVGRRDRGAASGPPRSGGPLRAMGGVASAPTPPAPLAPSLPASAQTGGGAVAADATTHDRRGGGSGRLGMVLGIGVAILLVAGIVVNAGLAHRARGAAAAGADVATSGLPIVTPAATATLAIVESTPSASTSAAAAPPPPPASATAAATVVTKRPRAPVVSGPAAAPAVLSAPPPVKPVETPKATPPAPPGANRALTDRK